MRDTKATRAIAALALVGGLGSLFLSFYPIPPRPNRPLHEALGQALAEEALRLQGKGGRLVVIIRETSEFESPATALQWTAFQRALRQAGQTVAQTKRIKIDPLRVVSVPAGDFFDLIRKSSEKDVIVSFMGPPALNEAQVAQLAGKRARIVALCTGGTPAQVDLRPLFAGDLLHAAVVSRRTVAVTGSEPTTTRGWFDRFYRVITPDNLSDLPPFRVQP
jgi:hypothetical protein